MSDLSHAPARQEAPSPLKWRSWPLRDSPTRAVPVVLSLVTAGLLVRWLTGHNYLAIAAVSALAVAAWRFFVPVWFVLSDHGVDQRVFGRQRRLTWRAIHHGEVCASGVLLLAENDRSKLASWRGLYVPWAEHRDEVIALVRHYAHVGEAAGGPL